MKIKFKIIILASFLTLMTSCDQWINPGLNNDPTAPTDVSLNVILPTTQANYAFLQGGDLFRFTNLFTQQLTGILRQHQGFYQYIFTESDVDNLWNSLYSDPMHDLTIMIGKAKAQGAPHYQGIAEVMLALVLGTTTDIWGDIPYSEAFKGQEGNLTPKYDTQEKIYDAIFALLNSAKTNLAATSSNFKPGADDFVYAGNLANWIKAANTLMARYYLHVKKNTEALAALSAGISKFDEDCIFNFGVKGNEANPIYQFMEERGDIAMGGKLMAIMNDVTDPRLPMYAELDGNKKYSEESTLGPYYYRSEAPILFVTFAEAKFIESEIKFGQGDKPGAYAAYLAGIKASCDRLGVAKSDADTLLANPKIAVSAGSLTLENIMNQKYVAMYTQPESWVDRRRTKYPSLIPVKGSDIIRRFPCAQSERLYNGANLKAAIDDFNTPIFVFSKVWWDKMW